MGWRDRVAWWLVPEKMRRLEELQSRMSTLYRWCAEFDQMCDAVDWIRDPPQEDIGPWRERMRQKYGKAVDR